MPTTPINNRLLGMFESLDRTDGTHLFPQTMLYCEGWMLRLVLDWFAAHKEVQDHELSVPIDGRWFSEGRITSEFLPEKRIDKTAEGYTHADGVIGHFFIRQRTKSGVSLTPNASHFVIVEAKMSSPLSARTQNIASYNQAARNVACIASLLKDRTPQHMKRLGFYVTAPKSKIRDIEHLLTKASIKEVVEQRVKVAGDRASSWFSATLLPTLDAVDIKPLSWEGIIDFISIRDTENGKALQEFYAKCLRHNERQFFGDPEKALQ